MPVSTREGPSAGLDCAASLVSIPVEILFRDSEGVLVILFFVTNSKDVRLPVQLQRAMAAEAEATREARAKVIAAEGEQRASR